MSKVCQEQRTNLLQIPQQDTSWAPAPQKMSLQSNHLRSRIQVSAHEFRSCTPSNMWFTLHQSGWWFKEAYSWGAGWIHGALKAIASHWGACAEAALCLAPPVVSVCVAHASVFCLRLVCFCVSSFHLFRVPPLTHQHADPVWHHSCRTCATSSLSVRSLETL